jgi:hypothetical protein
MSIAGGTSEITRNQIGERILELLIPSSATTPANMPFQYCPSPPPSPASIEDGGIEAMRDPSPVDSPYRC